MQARRDTAALQDLIVTAVKATMAGVRSKEVASVAGVNPSQVTHWSAEDDTHRQMRMPEIVALVRRYGADVVLAPLAALSGCAVVRVDGDAKACLDALRLHMWPAMGHMERHLSPGSEGGRGLSPVEAAEGLAAVEAWAEEAIRMRDAYRSAALGRAA